MKTAGNGKARVTRITIGRLYNLGNYEHVRYEIGVEVPEGKSASAVLTGLEKIITALSPKTSTKSRGDLEREAHHLSEMHKRLSSEGPEEFRRYHGHFIGTPEEYIARCEQSHAENQARRDAWEARSDKARKLLDDLGGAANWKDSKLDWEDDYDG